MSNPNSSAQRSFAAEPYDSVAAVLASKQITAALVGQRIYTKDGYCFEVVAGVGDEITAGGAHLVVITRPYDPESDEFSFKGVASRAEVNTLSIPSAVQSIQTSGYYEPGDSGGATYVRVSSEPPHAGKVQSADGAWWELFSEVITPYMFGAKGDGVADDTAAVQAAMAVHNPLHIKGVFNISAECSYSGGLTKRVYGNGDTSSVIRMTSASGNGLSKTAGTLILQDLSITTSVDKDSNTAAILIGGSYSGRDMVDNCRIYGLDGSKRLSNGISIETDVIPTIRNNYIVTCKDYGLLLKNTVTAGGGEAIVSGNTFNTSEPSNNGTAIAWVSGLGTLRVSDNIIQSYNTGIGVYPDASLTKAALIVSGNSFESNGYSSIAILRQSGGGEIRSVVISANEFDNTTGRHVIIQDAGGDNTLFVRQINISGNNHVFGVTDSVLLQAGVMLSVSGELFEAASGSSGLNAISITASRPYLGILGPILVFGTSATKYNVNGNTGITKVDESTA